MKGRRGWKTKCEQWDRGEVAITDCGNGVERIILPHCVVQVKVEERAGRQIRRVNLCAGIDYRE